MVLTGKLAKATVSFPAVTAVLLATAVATPAIAQATGGRVPNDASRNPIAISAGLSYVRDIVNSTPIAGMIDFAETAPTSQIDMA